jgi:hypothetical protein
MDVGVLHVFARSAADIRGVQARGEARIAGRERLPNDLKAFAR